jgi:hypothetical protein
VGDEAGKNYAELAASLRSGDEERIARVFTNLGGAQNEVRGCGLWREAKDVSGSLAGVSFAQGLLPAVRVC